MTSPPSGERSIRILGFSILCYLLLPKSAVAEKSIVKTNDYEVYTDGRVGGFLSYTRGDGLPRAFSTPDGMILHDVAGGGVEGAAERQVVPGTTPAQLTQGTIENFRIRSGFIGNTLGLGVRTPIDETTTITGYIQIWTYIEGTGRRKAVPVYPDARQGYLKVQGLWGSVLVGRARALFSRGATDIDAMYAHRYGVGFPGQTGVDNTGPTLGHIGYGVLGSGFAGTIQYATPVLVGLQLTAGLFDPVNLQGAWTRTKYPRPEAELTFDQAIGTSGKVVLFGNGAWQKLYREDSPQSDYAGGFGYGGRFEIGPVHLGAAGHYGRGLGLNYALEPSDATLDANGTLRKFDGYYVQSQVVLGTVDLSAGWGMTRVFLNPEDNIPLCGGNPCTGAPGEMPSIPHSVVKSQTGISAGVVWHITPALHYDFDYFRAQVRWFLGEKQNVNFFNTGLTYTW